MLSRFAKLTTLLTGNRLFSAGVTKFPELQRDFTERIIASNPVVVFMNGTPDNPKCHTSEHLVHLLKTYGVTDFLAVDLCGRPELDAQLKEYSQLPIIPQVYIHQKFLGGVETLEDLEEKGELESYLRTEGLLLKTLGEAIDWLEANGLYRVPECSVHSLRCELWHSAQSHHDHARWRCPKRDCTSYYNVNERFVAVQSVKKASVLTVTKLLFFSFATLGLSTKDSAAQLRNQGIPVSVRIAAETYAVARRCLMRWAETGGTGFVAKAGGIYCISKRQVLVDGLGNEHWVLAIADISDLSAVCLKYPTSRQTKAVLQCLQHSLPTSATRPTQVVTDDQPTYYRLKELHYSHVVGFTPEHNPLNEMWEELFASVHNHRKSRENLQEVMSEGLWRVHCCRHKLDRVAYLRDLLHAQLD